MGWLIYLALGVQFLAVFLVSETQFGLAKVMLITSYIALGPALLSNIRRPGIALVLVGAFLNFTAILVNGGSMPLDPRTIGLDPQIASVQGEGAGYLSWSKDTLQPYEIIRLRFLTDIFALPGPVKAAFSIGDVFIAAGLLVYLIRLALPRIKHGAVS